MTPNQRKSAIIVGSILVIGGVVGYFLYKKHKEKKQAGLGGGDTTNPATDTPSSTGNQTFNAPKPISSSPLGDTNSIKAFQDWMDMKHPNWVNGKNLNKGGGYGTFGPSTSKAYNTYGMEYSKPTSPATKPTTQPASNRMPVYALQVGTPIFDKVSDTIPYRLAGKGEDVGSTDGTIVKSYWGVPYYKTLWTDGKYRFVATGLSTLKA